MENPATQLNNFINAIKNIKTWDDHDNFYKKNIVPIANASIPSEKDKTLKVYQYRYTPELANHEFFKHFLISLVNVNHYDERTKINVSDINKIFNGFNTLECIFANSQQLKKSHEAYIEADKNLIQQLNKPLNKTSIDIMINIIKQYSIMQVLSYIDLCNTQRLKIKIKKITEIVPQVIDKNNEAVITDEILNSILNSYSKKLQTINDLKKQQMGNVPDVDITRSENDIDQMLQAAPKQGPQQQLIAKTKKLKQPKQVIAQSQQKIDQPTIVTLEEPEQPKPQTPAKQKPQVQTQPGVFTSVSNFSGGNDSNKHKYLKYKAKYLQSKYNMQ